MSERKLRINFMLLNNYIERLQCCIKESKLHHSILPPLVEGVFRSKMQKMLIILGLLNILFLQVFGSPDFVRNTLPEIDACEGKIRLTLVRTWGGDNTDDENQFFRFPKDIKISKDNSIYIVDSGNNRVQVFTRDSSFKETIGRKGQGPGDLLLPEALDFDKSGNLYVADFGNYRIQIFGPQGKYLDSFKMTGSQPTYIALTGKDEIAVYSYEKTFKSRSMITLYDLKGKIKREIGKMFDRSKSLLSSEAIFFTTDKNNSFYVSFYTTPCYMKYSYEGKLELIVTFAVPFQIPQVELSESKENIKVTGEKKERVSSGISIDQTGKFYLIAAARPLQKKERCFLVSDGNGTMRRYPKGPYPDKTDRFRLLVFSPKGKIIAARKLAVFCDSIYIHGTSLFILDTFIGMKIYEYKISFDT
jgi:hypothetical protein